MQRGTAPSCAFARLSPTARPINEQYLCIAHISAHPHVHLNVASVAQRESPAAGFDPRGVKRGQYFGGDIGRVSWQPPLSFSGCDTMGKETKD